MSYIYKKIQRLILADFAKRLMNESSTECCLILEHYCKSCHKRDLALSISTYLDLTEIETKDYLVGS